MIARLFFIVLALLSPSVFAAGTSIPATAGVTLGAVTLDGGYSSACNTLFTSKLSALTGSTYSSVEQAVSGVQSGMPATSNCHPTSNSTLLSVGPTSSNRIRVIYKLDGSTYTATINIAYAASYVCPSGYTGPLLVGSVQMCDPVNPCADRDKKPNDFLWVSYNKGQSPYGYRCKDGCQVSQTGPVSHPVMNPNGDWYTGGTADRHDLMQIQYYAIKCEANAQQSSTGDQPPPPVPPVPKAPKCDPSEGVLTTSTGKVVCVPEGMMGAPKPIESDTQKREEDANGVKNTTKNTTKDPITGATTVTEKTTDANGNVTSSSSSSSGAGGSGDNSGDEPGQCAKEPDSPICKKGTIKDKGKYGSDQDGKLEQAKAELTAKFSEIRGALSNQFRYNGSSSGGSLPCPAPVTVLGATISFCVADYSSSLSVIGDIIVFAATIIAAIIVVTA